MTLVLKGCSTLISSTEVRGQRLSEPQVQGEPKVVRTEASVSILSLNDIRFIERQEIEEEYLSVYQLQEQQRVREWAPDLDVLFGTALVGLLFMGLGGAFLDDEDSLFFNIGLYGLIGGSALSVAFGQTRTRTRNVDLDDGVVEETEVRSAVREVPYRNQEITVFSYENENEVLVYRPITDVSGRIRLREAQFLDAGIHPVTMMRNILPLTFVANGQKFMVEVPIRDGDRRLATNIVLNAGIEQLADASVVQLTSSSIVPINVTHNNVTKRYSLPLDWLNDEFYRGHFDRNEEALRMEFGPRLQNCRALSVTYREIYDCLRG